MDTEDTGSAVAEYLTQGAANPPSLAKQTQASVGIAIADKPDYEAELRRAATITGVPIDSARAEPDVVKREANLSAFDFDGIAARFPATAKYLSNVENARIAHDDVENMGFMEKLTTSFHRGFTGGLRGYDAEAVTESAQILAVIDRIQKGELDPNDYAKMANDPQAGRYASFFAGASGKPEAVEKFRQSMESRLAQNALEFTQRGATLKTIPTSLELQKFQQTKGFKEAGAQFLEHPLDLTTQVTSESLGGLLPATPFIVGSGIAGGARGLAVATGFSSFGQEYTNTLTGILTDMGVDLADRKAVAAALETPEFKQRNRQAITKAAVIGAFDAVTAGVAGTKLVSKPLGNLAAQTGVQMVGGAGGEAVGSVASGQDVSASAVISEAIGEIPGAGLDVGTSAIKAKVEARAEARKQTADAAAHNAAVVDQITKVAEASKLRERDPGSFEEFVKEAAKDAPVKDLYVDAKVYAQALEQAGLDPEAVSPTAASELQQQIAAGGDVRIPIEEFAARTVGTGIEKTLLDHLKTDPLGMSKAEAETYYQTFAEEQKAEVEKILAEKGVEDAFAQSHEAVKANILDQLATANRFTPDVNKSYATLMSSFYTTQAARLGITPEEMYRRYPLQIRAEELTGEQVMSQRKIQTFEGQHGNKGHITRKETGTAPTEAIAKLAGQKGEKRGEHRNRQGEAWEKFVNDIRENGIKEPIFIVKDPGQPAKIYEGNHRIDAALELGLPEVPVEIRYFGKSEREGLVAAEPVANAKDIGQNADKGNTYGQSTRSTRTDAQPQELQRTVGGGTPREGWADATRLRRKDGQPAPFYRGASRPLGPDDFAAGALGHATGHPSSGLGVWFTVDAPEAATYGDVGEYRLDVRNPKVFKIEDLPGFDSVEDAHAFRESLRKQGFDGIVVTAKHLGGKVHAVAFEPSQVIDSTQTLDQEARAQISFGNDITQGATIALLHNADLSSFLHEGGHFYLEVLNDLARRPDAVPEIAADMNALLKWFGVKDIATWNAMTLEEKRPFHEQFARGFEAYLFEGKAPSVELNSLFAKFRAWMINVYRQLSSLNVSLTDEVRGVMDRMLATNQEIVEAEATRGFAPLFKDAESANMTPDEWVSYQKLGAEATQEAVDGLQARAMRDMQWLDNAKSGKLKELQRDAADKRKAVRAEITDEVRLEPVYGAQRFIKYGELHLEGLNKAQREIAVNAGMTGTKLSLPALKEMYGEDPAAPWRYLPVGRHGLATATDGLHPDLVGELFGFSSGDEMVRAILSAEPEKSVIEGKTDQRMLERYGDLSSEQAIEKAVNEALHNDARSRFIATELAAVEKATGSRRTLARAAKEFAAQIVARQKIRDLKPARYEAAEARAAKKAEQGKDLAEKAVAKRDQLVNNYAAKAAYEASAEIVKSAKYLKKFDSAATRSSLDPSHIDQIDALLERFDLRVVSNKEAAKRASLAEWIKSQEEQGYSPVIPDELRDDISRKPYREMTVEEFRGLVDAVKNIEHLGRLKKKLLTAADNRDFDEVKSQVAGSIREHAKRTLPEERASDRGALVKIGRIFKGFTASIRKFASFARQFDGWQDGGAVWENLVRNMNERGDFEAVEREKATIKLHEILDPLLNGGKLGEKKFFASIGKSFTREERLGMALNMGNEVNRERVMSGERLSPAQLTEVLDTLSKEDWDAIQNVWDYIGSFWPQMQAKQRRLTGLTPEKVEASPVITKHGTYAGGYYPIKYDPYRSEKASADIDAEVQRQIQQGLYVASQTRRGHLKARTESTGRPLRYDLNVIAEHVDQVIHDLAWHEYLIDANRLLRSSAIEEAVRTHYGIETYRAMKNTLRDIAVGDMSVRGAAFLNWIRHGATISGLGLNVANTLINTIGITQSISRIGAKWVAKGAAHWVGDAVQLESSAKKVYEKSDFMRLRAKTMQREINELRNRIDAADSKLKKAYGKLLPAFFYLQTKSQQLVDIPTFWGAYEKAMAEPEMTEARAVELAEQAVRDAQGSGMTHDLSGIQREPALKIFTTFYHFFNTTYNLTVEAVGRTNFRKPSQVALLAADLALLYMVPALMQTIVMAMLRGEDDEEKVKKRLLADQISYVLAPVPFAREMTSGAQAAFGVGNGIDYGGPAATRFFTDFSKLGTQIGQGELDEGFWKSLNSVGGVLFHYPATQINRTVSGAVALSDGRTSNPGALLSGAPSNQ